MKPKSQSKNQAQLTLAHHDFERGLNIHAFSKTHDRSGSQDLVQATFMKTWLYLLRGGKIDLMRAFLYHVLNGLIIDEYRKRKTTSLDSLLERGFEPKETESERLINILDGKAAVLLIQRLPFKYQKIMRMRYMQELTLKEMSLITGESKNALAVQAHRGLEKLKQLYKGV
jgi:RNA polymerase sigma-70 factor (ECF subfamily)